jgi:hypothetical protein
MHKCLKHDNRCKWCVATSGYKLKKEKIYAKQSSKDKKARESKD